MAIYFGTSRNDTMRGTSENDSFFAGAGDDMVFGGFGNDTFYGSAGTDYFFGEQGSDWVDYSYSTTGVGVRLDAGLAVQNGETDYLSSIENVMGSDHDDFLAGDSGANIIRGRAGNDIIAGMGGADTLEGGEGIDHIAYGGSNAGVRVDLLNNTASGGHATGDVISGFESAIGSDYADTFWGTNGVNDLYGQLGNDTLYGRTGNDNLYGGDGNDTLDGGSGADVLIGGEGNDILIGGSGADTFQFVLSSLIPEGRDIIRDFDAGVDRIEILAGYTPTVTYSAEFEGIINGVLTYDFTIHYSPDANEYVTLDNIAVQDIQTIMQSIDFV